MYTKQPIKAKVQHSDHSLSFKDFAVICLCSCTCKIWQCCQILIFGWFAVAHIHSLLKPTSIFFKFYSMTNWLENMSSAHNAPERGWVEMTIYLYSRIVCTNQYIVRNNHLICQIRIKLWLSQSTKINYLQLIIIIIMSI